MKAINNFFPNNAEPTYAEVSDRMDIGIKTWGMIDFLGISIVRVKGKRRRRK